MKVLQRQKPYVIGCSVGAFIGGIFASGGLERLKRYVIDMDGESMFSFSDITLIRSGLLDGDKKLMTLVCMHSRKKILMNWRSF